MCAAFLFAGCAYEQDWGDAVTPDELSLSAMAGKSDIGTWYGIEMPDSRNYGFGISLTWKLK